MNLLESIRFCVSIVFKVLGYYIFNEFVIFFIFYILIFNFKVRLYVCNIVIIMYYLYRVEKILLFIR